MRIDPGLVVIMIAVSIFYLRLIILQRNRAKRAAFLSAHPGRKKGKASSTQLYSIISTNKSDWLIAGSGILLILLGVLLNQRVIPPAQAQSIWWLPVAIGIIAFSWGFK